MQNDLMAAGAWLSGAMSRSVLAMIVAAALVIAFSEGGVDWFDVVYGALWSGILWFALVETLVLLLLFRKRRPSSHGYQRRGYRPH